MIWELKSDVSSNFEELHLLDFDSDKHAFEQLRDKNQRITDWGDIKVYTMEENSSPSDFPKFWGKGDIPVVSDHVVNAISDLVTDQVEFLPLTHPHKLFYAVHVLNIIDAIDYNKALVKTLSSRLRVSFKKYAFHIDQIKKEHIFRVYLDEYVDSKVLVSDDFKDRVTSSSLTGYKFVEVWDSEM
ncbi:imm11 family protein [Mechercharimyces sp. CAU 1602]|uniref:imm11 family protein n=1 Tax=Mechercharimyces sp. CAU 1602 TaxID=2973933 RepID=UPI0037C4F0EE